MKSSGGLIDANKRPQAKDKDCITETSRDPCTDPHVESVCVGVGVSVSLGFWDMK